MTLITPYTEPTETMDELSFNEGDLIMLQTRVGDEWLRGKLINGHQGIFPKTFVEIVVSIVMQIVRLIMYNVHVHVLYV